jgi:hypothetical protein
MQKIKSPTITTAVIVVAIVVAAAAVVSSCGLKTIGSGIVLWSPDEEMIATGARVPVLGESELEGTYTISLGEEKTADLPKWRLAFFNSDKELENYINSREDFLRMVASAKIDSLAVRARQDPSSQRLYKLRRYEVMKIIGRSEEKSEIGDYVDYWYNVLTKDGTRGWCYGESLIIQEIGQEIDTRAAEEDLDPALLAFLGNVWRPEYFQTYIDDSTIDLEEFRPDIGIFPNPEEKTILHVTKRSSAEYTYTDIIAAGGSLYLFKGTPVKVRVYTPERIMFEYLENRKSVQKLYVLIDENIEELAQKELDRRWEQYSDLTENGNVFSSQAYGTIEFTSFTKFRWTDYQRLVPEVIPPGLKENTGKLEFSLFLGDSLKPKYDGALKLTFPEKKEQPAVLLYNRIENGVRFIYAPPSSLTGTVVEREPAAPIVMFFSVQGE